MQERYLGDSHDFLKYHLLRHLHRQLGLTLGVNWYLTLSEQVDRIGNNDGEKRHHLKGKDWPATDPDLFERIGGFAEPANRKIENVAAWDILPAGTIYHTDILSHQGRDAWHTGALEHLRSADLVFLDPDNGFEVPSMSRRTSPKYALYAEAVAYARRGQVLVGIQFARQCDPVQRAYDIRANLVTLVGPDAALPVIRGRVAPNILFFATAPKHLRDGVEAALRSFAERSHKAELVEVLPA